MIRKARWFLFGLFVMCCVTFNSAKVEAETSSDGYWTYKVTDSVNKEVTLTGITEEGLDEYGTTIVIPSTIIKSSKEYKVTAIGENAFKRKHLIKSVFIPEGVTSIGASAFYDCSAMQSVTLPDTLDTIEALSFACCISLKSIKIPDSVTKIRSDAFNTCTALALVELPETLVNLQGGIFWYTPWLQKLREESEDGLVIVNTVVIDGALCTGDVTIPEGVTRIAPCAFFAPRTKDTSSEMQAADITSVTIPEGVITVKESAFKNCVSLEKVELPESLIELQGNAFYGCTSLKNIQLPDTMDYLWEKVFYNCSSLESIVLPSGIKELKAGAFSGCTSLKSITLPAALTTVGENVFPENEGLVIVIPEELTDISNLGLTELTNVVFEVTVDSPVILYLTENNITYNTYESETKGDEENPTGGDPSEDDPTEDPSKDDPTEDDPTEDNPIQDSTTEEKTTENGSAKNETTTDNPAKGEESKNDSQTTVEKKKYQIGKTYTVKKYRYKILAKGKVSFAGCTNKKVKKLTIPATIKLGKVTYKVVSVKKKACKGYSKLTTVTVGKYVSSVGDEAFMNCKKLKNITFGTSVKTIGKRVLKGDKRLRTVTFKGKKLKKVGKGTFSGVSISKVTFKVPKSRNGKYVKKYKKLFQKAM